MSKPIFSDDGDIARTLAGGRTLYGPGWRCVPSLNEFDDDEYEEEEEEYVVLDLGTTMDSRTLQTEAAYQLIGMDTPLPFLRIGENIFEGRITPLVGDEVILDVVRHEDDPQKARYQPILKTSQRVTMRGVTLEPRGLTRQEEKPARSLRRGMFPARVWKLPKDDKSTPSTPSTPAKPFTPYDEETTERRRRMPGSTKSKIQVSTLGDLVDIANAGGLGEMKLDIAADAHPDLLDAVTDIRGGKPWEPGSLLSKAQEERLLLNLPASGPGSRGGKGSRTGRRGGSRRGRGGRPKGRTAVHESGEGLGDGFLGVGDVYREDSVAEGSVADGGSVAGPSGTQEAMAVDSDEELREIGEDELREMADDAQ